MFSELATKRQLVCDQQRKAKLPKSCPSESKHLPLQSPPEFSYLRKAEPCLQPDVEGASPCETVVYGMVSVLARKVIKAARWITSSIQTS